MKREKNPSIFPNYQESIFHQVAQAFPIQTKTIKRENMIFVRFFVYCLTLNKQLNNIVVAVVNSIAILLIFFAFFFYFILLISPNICFSFFLFFPSLFPVLLSLYKNFSIFFGLIIFFGGLSPENKIKN